MQTLLSIIFVCIMVFASAVRAENPRVMLDGPFGIACDSKDVVYVAEIQGKRISKFSPDGKPLGAIERIEGYGPLAGPFDVAIGSDGRILIADTLAHRVIVLDANEKLLFVLGSDKSAEPGHFGQPHFVTTNSRGEIFVADTFNARIQKFSADGKLLLTFGRIGTGPGEFLGHGYVGGISCAEDLVFVRETDGGRIDVFREDGSFVKTISRRGDKPGELDEGYGCVVIDGTIFSVNTFASRIERFDLDGKLLSVWNPGEGNGREAFNHPVDLCRTANGQLLLTDWKNSRIVRLDANGKFLGSFGGAATDWLTWQPPARRERPPGHRVVFSIYGGPDAQTIERCVKSGITRIYWSFDGQAGDWPGPEVIEQARARGVDVVPSIACNLLFNQTPYALANLEKCDRKYRAEAADPGQLAWSSDEVRRLRAGHIARQAERAALNGVMLDYIRYLGSEFGYEPAAVGAFRTQTGIDPLTLSSDDPRWLQFRADYVTQFIVELRRELARLDRPIEISVFAGTEPNAAMQSSMQDWPTWVKMGIVDKLNPGYYTRDQSVIYENIAMLRRVCPDRTRINCFVACYGGNLNTPELLEKGIDTAIAAGADEVTIYRVDVIDELNLWDAIGRAEQKANGKPTSAPAR